MTLNKDLSPLNLDQGIQLDLNSVADVTTLTAAAAQTLPFHNLKINEKLPSRLFVKI